MSDGLDLTPEDLAVSAGGKRGVQKERAARDRARLAVVLRAGEEAFRARDMVGWPALAARAEAAVAGAETSGWIADARTVVGELRHGSFATLPDALEGLRFADEGLRSQAGELDPGLIEQLWTGAVTSDSLGRVVEVGVAARRVGDTLGLTDDAVGEVERLSRSGRTDREIAAGKQLGDKAAIGVGIAALVVVGLIVWRLA